MVDAQYSQADKKEIVVLGAGMWLHQGFVSNFKDRFTNPPGVIGLTTGIILQERGDYRVTIIASIFPGDYRSSGYTSHWAVSESPELKS